jgi:MFS family permease
MKLLTDISPLRDDRRFRKLWAGSTLSAVGSSLTNFALVLQVYDTTRSTFAVGAISLCNLVPTLALGLFGGSLADAVDRRKLVLICTSGQAVVSLGLAAQAFAGLSAVWLLYALAATASVFGTLNAPARQTFIPTLLPAGKLAAGLALNRVSFQVVLLAGPALAGLITAAAGLRVCYLVDAISFAAALYGVASLPAMSPSPGAARPGLRAVAEGIGFIRRSQVLAGTFLADLNATVFGLPVALFPAINAERFGGSPVTLGLFTASIGAGGLVSSAVTGPVRHIARQGVFMLCTVAIWGAAFAGFALAHRLWLVLALLAVAGAADTFTVVLRSTIVQSVTTEALRGRLSAAEYVVGASGGSAGNLEAGALGSLTSPTISALAGGLVTVAMSAVIGLALPGFARYRADRRVSDDDSGDRSIRPAWPADNRRAAKARVRQ